MEDFSIATLTLPISVFVFRESFHSDFEAKILSAAKVTETLTVRGLPRTSVHLAFDEKETLNS